MDVPWCFFSGRQENNADIDDGKDVTKDVSAESAEDSGQNLQVCLLGKFFRILQCKSCSFLSFFFSISLKSLLSNLNVRCKQVSGLNDHWMKKDSIQEGENLVMPRSDVPFQKKSTRGFISVGGLWSCVLGSSEWIEEMSSCETIFNLANTMMGSGWGANFSHISTENVWTRWRDTPGFFGVFTFCLNNTQVVLKVSKQNSQTTQADQYVHYSWFTLMFLLHYPPCGSLSRHRCFGSALCLSTHQLLGHTVASAGRCSARHLSQVFVKFKPWRNPPRR